MNETIFCSHFKKKNNLYLYRGFTLFVSNFGSKDYMEMRSARLGGGGDGVGGGGWGKRKGWEARCRGWKRKTKAVSLLMWRCSLTLTLNSSGLRLRIEEQ